MAGPFLRHVSQACWSGVQVQQAPLGTVAVENVAYRDPGMEVSGLTELAAMAGVSTALHRDGRLADTTGFFLPA